MCVLIFPQNMMFSLKVLIDVTVLSIFILTHPISWNYIWPPSADPEGGTGGPDPPGKSQDIWVSIGNKQLDPPPPPPPWKKLDPLWNLEKW